MQISRSNRYSPPQRQQGFTLIEVILVVVLIAIAGSTVASIVSRKNDGARLRRTAQQLGLSLRQARTLALRTQETQALKLYPSKHFWLGSNQKVQQFDADIHSRIMSGQELSESSAEGVILFYPDGASSGGAVELSTGGHSWRAEVNWVSGAVTLKHEGGR